jgi:hypothetical protein
MNKMKIEVLRMIFLYLPILFLPVAARCEPPCVESGTEAYLAAQRTTVPEERQQLLNQALSIYLSSIPDHPSGKLLNNIGNIYFTQGNYGMAVCYYRRAAVQMPRDGAIQKNLKAAAARAGVSSLQQDRPLYDAIGLRWCSPLERDSLLLGGIVVSLVFFSLNLWLPAFGFQCLCRVCAFFTCSAVIALIWYALIVPPLAVIVKAAPVRPSSNETISEPAVTTVRPGEVVAVLGTEANHHLVKVKTASEATGYVLSQDLCFIY